MSEQESKKEQQTGAGQSSAPADISLDIENALSFIETEEYEKAPPPKPAPVTEKRPSTAKSVADEPVRQQKPDILEVSEKKESPPTQKIPRFPIEESVITPGDSKENKGTNIWILLAGVAVLVVLAFVFFW